MNTINLKSYAPQARRDFLAAVTTRALRLGISETGIAPVTIQGDIMLIGGTAYLRSLDAQRNQMIAKIKKSSFAQVMEEAAYTWFNRFMAIRYMEVHGYFTHGFRVLSNPSGGSQPEILQHAQNVDIPGLDKKRVLELLSQGNQQEELYRTLILAQSKALGQAMPFLFDTIDTSTELLLPDGLLAPQSVVRKLVGDIPEDDWHSTEILGWLYQFYVSDEKARVDALVKKGQAVQPEDIPAKTQLFTPNWIVQFMTQNSLGRLWMDVYPDSPLKDKMPYYTGPADQEPEVAAKLREITPRSLDPNTLTAIDPAAGSGHILLVLYDLFYEFYREWGYPPNEIPRLILSQNLYGLELDRRAAQIAGFAVLVRARRDDPTLLDKPPVVNVLSILSSYGIDAEAVADTLLAPIRAGSAIVPEDGLFPELAIQPRLAEADSVKSEATKADIMALIALFEEAGVYGSLIRVADPLAKKLPAVRELVKANLGVTDLDRQATARELDQLVRQAEFLAARYTVCVANPPYLGGKAMPLLLKGFVRKQYPSSGSELYACFMQRGFDFAKKSGWCGFITTPNWMFLSTFDELRVWLLGGATITCMAHIGRGAFGSDFGTTAFVFRADSIPNQRGEYRRLFSKQGSVSSLEELKARYFKATPNFATSQQFKDIPGWPIAYWITDNTRVLFRVGTPLGRILEPKQGLSTADNSRFVRYWWEPAFNNIGVDCKSRDDAKTSSKRWYPFNKGGEFRRWYGNNLFVVDWENDGERLLANRPKSVIRNPQFFFRPNVNWTDVTSGGTAFRLGDAGAIFEAVSPTAFSDDEQDLLITAAYGNTPVVAQLAALLNPTLHFHIGYFAKLPMPPLSEGDRKIIASLAEKAIDIARQDWSENEATVNFALHRLVRNQDRTLSKSYEQWIDRASKQIDSLLDTESRINEIFITAAQLVSEISSRSTLSTCVLLRPSRCEDICSLIHYSVGCMLGRFSLDEPGLVYAHQGGQGFDLSRYKSFSADQDGILPVTEDDYFGEEDTANRVARWVKTVWPDSPLDENLDFIADALGRKTNETALEAIRRYLATDFYKDHMQTYKKRPIYWLFSSGKHRAFQALVYLHRYNESTLSRMREHYVRDLFGKLDARIITTQNQSESGSASERNTAKKRLEKLKNQLAELTEFDAKLHHYALQRISLDLDCGVKVNYGKFSDPNIGEILANVKDITGGKDE